MVLRILVCLIFLLIGYMLCYLMHKRNDQNNVGNLLMIEDEESPMFMLEINAGKINQIKPGRDIILTVTRP